MGLDKVVIEQLRRAARGERFSCSPLKTAAERAGDRD
jgi:hypothetical protein